MKTPREKYLNAMIWVGAFSVSFGFYLVWHPLGFIIFGGYTMIYAIDELR